MQELTLWGLGEGRKTWHSAPALAFRTKAAWDSGSVLFFFFFSHTLLRKEDINIFNKCEIYYIFTWLLIKEGKTEGVAMLSAVWHFQTVNFQTQQPGKIRLFTPILMRPRQWLLNCPKAKSCMGLASESKLIPAHHPEEQEENSGAIR